MSNNSNPMPRISVTDRKQAELDRLKIAVNRAQAIVDEKQTQVDSFTSKLNRLNGFLTTAEAALSQAKGNRSTAVDLIQQAKVLLQNATTAASDMKNADVTTNDQAVKMAKLIDQLIMSAQVTNKLQTIVVRKKAKNPLISDELIALLAQAGTEANEAIVLCMTALKSTFAAKSGSDISKGMTKLAAEDCANLYQSLGGNEKSDTTDSSTLLGLLNKALGRAEKHEKDAKSARDNCATQLDHASQALSAEKLRLQSLHAQLAAATAAALAS